MRRMLAATAAAAVLLTGRNSLALGFRGGGFSHSLLLITRKLQGKHAGLPFQGKIFLLPARRLV